MQPHAIECASALPLSVQACTDTHLRAHDYAYRGAKDVHLVESDNAEMEREGGKKRRG